VNKLTPAAPKIDTIVAKSALERPECFVKIIFHASQYLVVHFFATKNIKVITG
jgi:hypothetical protein